MWANLTRRDNPWRVIRIVRSLWVHRLLDLRVFEIEVGWSARLPARGALSSVRASTAHPASPLAGLPTPRVGASAPVATLRGHPGSRTTLLVQGAALPCLIPLSSLSVESATSRKRTCRSQGRCSAGATCRLFAAVSASVRDLRVRCFLDRRLWHTGRRASARLPTACGKK